jgi:5-methylcytosine-specific restriction endonuclease McrA
LARAPDPFYQSLQWKSLRRACLERDRFTCTTPGCRQPAKCVDHIVSRRRGGPDRLSNLRSLCSTCDNKIKELASGDRRNGGVSYVTGVDGWPIV